MIDVKERKIGLVGNPNSGKSSLFNQLTALRQKVGNFSGVTVEKKSGSFLSNRDISIVDLPGLYDLYPNSLDEAVVLKELLKADEYDAIIYVADASHIDRALLLYTQLADMGLPMLFVLNMVDEAKKAGYEIEAEELSKRLGVEVVLSNAKTGEGLSVIKEHIEKNQFSVANAFFRSQYGQSPSTTPSDNAYKDWIHEQFDSYLSANSAIKEADSAIVLADIEKRQSKSKELSDVVLRKVKQQTDKDFTDRLDRWLLHPVWGYVIFGLILFVMFQAVYSWASWPMDLIDGFFGDLSGMVQYTLGDSWLSRLITEGIIPGIGGVVIFIPQIAILFLFIGLLEMSGYMSRVVFLMDRGMQKFGLSGKSVVPLISGLACAIPAVMATRSIENRKERLLSILVTPFMTCSARLPVYAILIALTIPATNVLPGINLQGLVLLALYLLGTLAALVGAAILNRMMKMESNGYFVAELPIYRWPVWKDLLYTIWNKVKTFVWQAGKIIFVISILLWVAASFGPNLSEKVEQKRVELKQSTNLKTEGIEEALTAYQLEHSYAGYLGKAIEPIVRPLGYDWKISIALLTSFAAREVFVGTLATIYSIGDADDEAGIIARMEQEVDSVTGDKRFNLPTALSLMVFYAFAMQCMSTLAIVKRETNSWTWPILQLVFMTIMAYVSALVVYWGVKVLGF